MKLPLSFVALALSCAIFACSSQTGLPNEPTGSGGTSSASGGSAGASSGGSASGGAGSVGAGGEASSGGVGAGAGGEASSGGVGGEVGSGGDNGSGEVFTLTSPAFENVVGCAVENSSVCDVFPDENVSYMDNANMSPELHWTGVPPGTQSFAVFLRDASYGQAHWALWNIPADSMMLAADVEQDTPHPEVPVGSQQANANFATTSEDGYFGPHMPCNVYDLEVYALSASTFTPMRPESAVLVWIEISELVAPEVLGVAKLRGRGNMPTCE